MPEEIKITPRKNTPQVNKYYIHISAYYRAAKYVTITVLVAFVVIMLLTFRDSITYENFQYMLRDLDTIGTSEIFSTINYEADGVPKLELFRGDLIVAGTKSVSLYNIGGRRTLTQSVAYSEPVVRTSDKYFLVYDAAGSSYSLYNSYSKLYSETLDYTITDADVSDKGIYAVVTSTREYPYAVYLYSKDFKRIGEYYKNKYIMDVRVRADGEQLLIASFDCKDGAYYTEIVMITPGHEEAERTITCDGVLPLEVVYNDGGGFTLVCDSALIVYSSTGDIIEKYDFGTKKLSKFELSSEYSSILLKESENSMENNIVLFDTAGNILYNNSVYGKVSDIGIYGKYIYCLCDNTVTRTDVSTGDTVSRDIAGGALRCLIAGGAGTGDAGSAIVCYQNYASAMSIS